MAVQPVRLYGDPLLRQKAGEVAKVDDAVRHLIEDLRETMRAYRGVGLAANQIGVLRRVLVVDVPIEDGRRTQLAVVNPMLTERAGSEVGEEGCLSIPGVFEDVRRPGRVRVKGWDEEGRPVDLTLDGYLARAVQHEVDHLDGVLLVDRLSPLRRQFLKRSLEALARGEVPEGYRDPVGPGGSL